MNRPPRPRPSESGAPADQADADPPGQTDSPRRSLWRTSSTDPSDDPNRRTRVSLIQKADASPEAFISHHLTETEYTVDTWTPEEVMRASSSKTAELFRQSDVYVVAPDVQLAVPVISTLLAATTVSPIVILKDMTTAEGITALMAGADFAVRPPLTRATLRALEVAYLRRLQLPPPPTAPPSDAPSSAPSAVSASSSDDAPDDAPVEAAVSSEMVASVAGTAPLLCLRDRHCTVVIRGQLETLSERPYALFRYLVQHRDSCCTRDELLRAIWGLDFNPETNVIDVQIYRLRSMLGRHDLKHTIETVRGRGYTLNTPSDAVIDIVSSDTDAS